MEQMKVTSLSYESQTSDSKITITNHDFIKNLKSNSRITKVELNLEFNFPIAIWGDMYYGATLVDRHRTNSTSRYCCNITDCIKTASPETLLESSFNLGGIRCDCINTSRSYLSIEYEPLTKFSDNHVKIERSFYHGGNLSLNVADNSISYQYKDAVLQCGAQAFALSHDYNSLITDNPREIYINAQSMKLPDSYCGRGFALNVQQYVIKQKITSGAEVEKDIYTYVDSFGKAYEFEDRFYYNTLSPADKDNNKVYINKSDAVVSADGELSYLIMIGVVSVKKEVFKEQITDSGLELSSTLEDFKDIKYLEQRPDEIAQLEDSIEQLSDAITSFESDKTNLAKDKEQQETSLNNNLMQQQNELANIQNSINIAHISAKQNTKEIEKINKTKQYYIDEIIRMEAAKIQLVADKFQNGRNYITQRGSLEYSRIQSTVYHEDDTTTNSEDDTTTNSMENRFRFSLTGQEQEIANCLSDKNEVFITFSNGIYSPQKINITENAGKTMKQIEVQIEQVTAQIIKLKDDLKDLCGYNYDTKVVDQEYASQLYFAMKQTASIAAQKIDLTAKKATIELGIAFTRNQIVYLAETVSDKSKYYNKEIAKYTEQKEKHSRQLALYKAQSPTVYIKSGGNAMCFAPISDGSNMYHLIAIVGGNNEVIQFRYCGDRLTDIQGGDKVLCTLQYYADSLISSIKDNDGNTCTYVYNSGNLVSAKTAGGEITRFEYQDNAICRIVDCAGNGVRVNCSAKQAVITRESLLDEISLATDPKCIDFTKQPKDISKQVIDYFSAYTARVSEYVVKSNIFTLTAEKTYQFDIHGRATCSYDGKGNTARNVTSFVCDNAKRSFSISPMPYGKSIDCALVSGSKSERDFEYYLSSDLFAGDIDFLRDYGNSDSDFELDGRDSMVKLSVDISAIKSADYLLTAFAKADSFYICNERVTDYNGGASDVVCADSCQLGRRFELRAEIQYLGEQPTTQYASFDWKITDWQYLSFPITIDLSKTLLGMYIYADYSNNFGICQIGRLDLKEAMWDYNEYNADKQVVYLENSLTDYITEYSYNADKQLVSQVTKDKQGNEYPTSYEYNMDGALIRTTDYRGMVEESIFDSKGAQTKSVRYNISEPAFKFYSEQTVADSGELLGEVDERGGFNSAEYEYLNDNMSAVKSANGHKVAMGYDGHGELSHIGSCVDDVCNGNVLQYRLGHLVGVQHNDFNYDYTYDAIGRTTKLNISGDNYATKAYDDVAMVNTATYANGAKFTEKYDKDGNATSVAYANGNGDSHELLANEYDFLGNIVTTIDKSYGKSYTNHIAYDALGNVKTMTCDDVSFDRTYDVNGNVVGGSISIGGTIEQYGYTYDNTPDSRLMKVNLPSGIAESVSYDALGRVKRVDGAASRRITYLTCGDHATSFVNGVQHVIDGKIATQAKYTYDKCGNIERIYEGGRESVAYTYDGLNRLVREDNKAINLTYTYAYDGGGNTLQKSVYSYSNVENIDTNTATSTHDYSYRTDGWRDQLLSFDGETFEYDSIGNPTIYRGKVATWKYGRQLASLGDVSYTYNASGLRKSKTALGITTRYILDGSNIISQTDGVNTLTFRYGADGICGVKCNNAEYAYLKNIQGDITHILDTSGNTIAKYVYDAWGNHKAYKVASGVATLVYDSIDTGNAGNTNGLGIENNANGSSVNGISASKASVLGINAIANYDIVSLNPFRYRGYYFDSKTSLYYLQSRYYDSQLGRFINADDISYLAPETINGLNLYAYCNNNPVMYSDRTGTSPWTDFWNSLAGKIIGTILVVGAMVAITILTAGVGTAITGALGGGIMATILGGAVGGAISGAVFGAGLSLVGQGVSNGYGNVDWVQVGIATLSGALTGAILGTATSGIKVAQAAKMWDKGTFKSGFQSMRYHYAKHGAGFGNIINYTKGAANFATRNASLLKYTFNYAYGNASWNFAYLLGNGGMFTSLGKIITFW